MMVGLGVLHDRLHGKLWHTTRPSFLPAIIASGGLSPEPNIDNAHRWKASRGAEFYPFVRKLGGVSLFDFNDFDPESYNEIYPLSNWYDFVPHRIKDHAAVWIEINQYHILNQFISTKKLRELWRSGDNSKHTFMPEIEAACIGMLPRKAFLSAFLTWADGQCVREIDLRPFDIAQFKRQENEAKSGSV